jgi:hypothetical protein
LVTGNWNVTLNVPVRGLAVVPGAGTALKVKLPVDVVDVKHLRPALSGAENVKFPNPRAEFALIVTFNWLISPLTATELVLPRALITQSCSWRCRL